MKLHFKTIGTGSSGNCYLFFNDDISFIIDAGIKVNDVLSYIPNFKSFKGVFLTHEHSDHTSHLKQYIDLGMKIHCTGGTAKSLSLNQYNKIEYLAPIYLSEYVTITPIQVHHNAEEPTGFIIDHYGERTLFATDCNDIMVDVSHVKNFIIEANHCLTMMEKTELNYQAFTFHMSIDNAIGYINKNKGLQTESIYLIHLSNRNANEKIFIDRSFNETNILTQVPKRGQTFTL